MSLWPDSTLEMDQDKPWASSEASLLLPVLPQDDLFDGLMASWTNTPFAVAANGVKIKSKRDPRRDTGTAVKLVGKARLPPFGGVLSEARQQD